MTIVYGFADLVIGIMNLIWTLAVELPAQAEVSQEMLAKAEGENKELLENMTQWAQYAVPSQIGVILFGLLYPMLVLVVLFWPSVAAVFRGEVAQAPEEPDDLRPEDRWRV
jgi:hypothetical protein